MRITFVMDSFGGGGKERRCLQLIQGLNNKGNNQIQLIIINNDIAYDELYETDVELTIIDRKNRQLSPLATLKELSSLVKAFNPDVLQVWGVFGAFFTNFIKLTSSFKYIGAYVADCNSPKPLSLSRLIVFINKILADKIIGNSKAGLAAYGVPQNKATLIYNGFNPERLKYATASREDLKREFDIQTKFVIPMVSRHDNDKDYKTFIQAAKRVTESRDDVTFLCVGNFTDSDECMNLVDVTGNNRIRFLGFRTDVESILAMSDLSVLCTNPNQHKEGVSNAILESMVFNVPVIATNDGGTPEIIEPGVNGYLIPPFDADALAQRIDEVLSDFEHYANVFKNVREYALDKFSLQKMIQEYDKVYKSLIEAK